MNFFLGLLSPVYWFFPRFYIPFLWGELKFLVDTLFKFIIFFYLGFSRVILLSLNNLFLVFLFMGFVYSVPYLSINKVMVFQPFYFIVLSVEDFRPNCVAFFLYFVILPRSFVPLPGFLFICGPTPLHRPTFKVIWFFGSIFYCFYYIFVYFLSSVSAFVLYFLFWVSFIPLRGFVLINFFIRPFICVFISIFNFIGNWVKNIK